MVYEESMEETSVLNDQQIDHTEEASFDESQIIKESKFQNNH